MDGLEEFLKSLSNEDTELIKMIPLLEPNNRDKLLELDHIQFKELIDNSISLEELGKLSTEQLQRREELISQIKRIRTRLILVQHSAINPKGEQKQYQQKQNEGTKYEVIRKTITVSEAIRRNDGNIKVKGVIASLSAPFKMISKTKWQCTQFPCGNSYDQEHNPPLSSLDSNATITCLNCKKTIYNPIPQYINAKTIQIQDGEPKGELERLDAFLFEKHTENVNAGEVVELSGDIHIQNQSSNGNNKSKRKLFTVLYAQSITYEHKQELTLTKKDIEAFYRFANIPHLIDRLVSMTAPNVIGENDKKLGILRSSVGAQESSRRGRINTLFVGPPGTAKSMLTREATKLVPNSRYVTAQNASGKSLTAIIDKENDNTILRLGPIPLAKNAICAINEIGSMNFDDQRFLLDIMEEGRFTIDKYGIHQDIDSPTTIIATANPHGTYWNKESSSDRINNEQIPVIRALLDRFDQVYGFSDSYSEEEIRKYADKKIEISNRPSHNYNFLTRYLLYAKSIVNLKIQPQAISMLNAFWQKLKIDGIATNRTFDTIYRIAESHARLHLKDTIDTEIAFETMESMRYMLLQYGHIIQIIDDPREVACQEITNIIRESKAPITFSEALKLASQRDIQINHYFGDKKNFTVEDNKRFRDLRERFIECRDTRIVITSMKPLTLFWSEDDHRKDSSTTDPTDRPMTTSIENLMNNDNLRSDRSDRSVGSNNQRTIDRENNSKFEYDCYYCDNYQTDIRTDYEIHVLQKHPGKVCYPNKASLEKMRIKGKGKPWEM